MDTADGPLDPAVVFQALTESDAILFADSADPAFHSHRAATWVAGVTPAVDRGMGCQDVGPLTIAVPPG